MMKNRPQDSVFSSLPHELLQGIGIFLNYKDAKSLSLSNRNCYFALDHLFLEQCRINLEKWVNSVVNTAYDAVVNYYCKEAYSVKGSFRDLVQTRPLRKMYSLFHMADKRHALKFYHILDPAHQFRDEFKLLVLYVLFLKKGDDLRYYLIKKLTKAHGKNVVNDINDYVSIKFSTEKLPLLQAVLNDHIYKNHFFAINQSLKDFVYSNIKHPPVILDGQLPLLRTSQ